MFEKLIPADSAVCGGLRGRVPLEKLGRGEGGLEGCTLVLLPVCGAVSEQPLDPAATAQSSDIMLFLP